MFLALDEAVVLNRRRFRGGRWQGFAVQAVFQDRLHALVGVGAERQGAPAGRLQALVAVAFAQPHEAQATAEALLRMHARSQDLLYQRGGGHSAVLGPADQALQIELGYATYTKLADKAVKKTKIFFATFFGSHVLRRVIEKFDELAAAPSESVDDHLYALNEYHLWR